MKINLLIGVLSLFIFSKCTKTQKEQLSENTSFQSLPAQVFADRIDLSDLEGNKISLSTYRNKIIIINVWATWCKPCITEMPSLVDMQKQLSSENYVLLLASSESLEKINSFKEKNNYDFKYVQLNTPPESLGIYALPTTFIINEQGELIITENGSKDWSDDESIKEITNLFTI